MLRELYFRVGNNDSRFGVRGKPSSCSFRSLREVSPPLTATNLSQAPVTEGGHLAAVSLALTSHGSGYRIG